MVNCKLVDYNVYFNKMSLSHSHTHTHTHQWPSTRHVVLIEQDAVSSLIDFMQKVYVTQPDIMYLACKLLHTYSITNPYKVIMH